MNLTIDLSKKEVCLILKKGTEEIDSCRWDGLYQLSETLIDKIDKLLRKNKVELEALKEIKVIPSKKSMVGTRIAKAVALGLKTELSC
jgi:tRNA A37 threonylcarbamoyladenosine modification protein TsaB